MPRKSFFLPEVHLVVRLLVESLADWLLGRLDWWLALALALAVALLLVQEPVKCYS
jgi:hypothetical protein